MSLAQQCRPRSSHDTQSEWQRHEADLTSWLAWIGSLDASDFPPELHAAFLECQAAEYRNLPQICEVRRNEKTKLGRPSMWRNHRGIEFITAVKTIREIKHCST